jgi:serine/threonine protein kinase
MSRQIVFDSSVSEKSRDWIRSALKINESDRMSWDDAFNHPLFSELNRLDDNNKENLMMTPSVHDRKRSVSQTNRRDRSPNATREKDSDMLTTNRTPRSKMDRIMEVVTPSKSRKEIRELSALKNNRMDANRSDNSHVPSTRDLLKLLKNKPS